MENQIQVMIHSCNQREWYVNEFLVPAILQQGLPHDKIKIWNDYHKVGNLCSWLESCKWIIDNQDLGGSIWHLQDDILISKDFVKTIEKEYQEKVCAGFVCEKFNAGTLDKVGRVPAQNLWYSFPCIKIYNKWLEEFYNWMMVDAIGDKKYKEWFNSNKNDDSFFRDFVRLFHHREYILNMIPCLVQHIDFLIGGSIINSNRGKDAQRRARWFEDKQGVQKLKNQIKKRGPR